MSQQRILIVLDAGKFQGASITNDKGDPQPLDLAALALLVPTINTAALAEVDSTAAKIAQLDAITAAIADPTKNDAATLIAIEDAVAEAKLTDRQRELIELQQMRADIDAKIADLSDEP